MKMMKFTAKGNLKKTVGLGISIMMMAGVLAACDDAAPTKEPAGSVPAATAFPSSQPNSGAAPSAGSATQPIEVSAGTASATPEPSATATSTADPRNSKDEEREEIANNIKSAEELIEEGLTDDAKMIIDALKTRNLTEEEKEQVKQLQITLNKVSD